MDEKVLCVIPAKEHSRRLPNKNFLEFNERPLLVWTVLMAKEIGKVVISSDSKKAAYVATSLGVDIANRPKELLEDNVDSWEVALQVAGLPKYKDFDTIILLQPSSPLLTVKKLEHALFVFREKKLPCLVSITPDAKFSGNFIIIDKEIFLRQKTIWVPGLFVMVANYGDIDDISDFRVLEAIQKGRLLE